MNIKRHRFDIEQISAAAMIDSRAIRMARYDAREDLERQALVHSLTAHLVAGCPRDVTLSIDIPATWVQHLKKRLGMAHRTVTVSTTERVNRRVCPHLGVPEVGRCVEFLSAEFRLDEIGEEIE